MMWKFFEKSKRCPSDNYMGDKFIQTKLNWFQHEKKACEFISCLLVRFDEIYWEYLNILELSPLPPSIIVTEKS